MKFNIERSSKVDERNTKILFWGDTGTRKTETILRNFPRVLLIDTEYNSDQCVDMPEIPEFMRYQTKDVREIMAIIDEIKAGRLKFFDGKPFETFAIDSITVPYSTMQEVGMKVAEDRAVRYNRDIATANLTQSDWGLIKRPLKQLQNRINGTGIRYLCLTARQKDLYEEINGESKKTGVVEDTVKGLKYEMNLSLHFEYAKNGEWFYTIDKVQGGLSKIFPLHGKGKDFPMKELETYTKLKKTVSKEIKSEDEIADEMVKEMTDNKPSKEGLLEVAKKHGFEAKDVKGILNKHDIPEYDDKKWKAMVSAIEKEAELAKSNGSK
jgi:hypothetical protein